MPRDRSRSIVQNIASKVVPHAADDWTPGSDSSGAQQSHNPLMYVKEARLSDRVNKPRQRATSMSSSDYPKVRMGFPTETALYPFTRAEEDSITQSYLRRHGYDSVLDYKHICEINDHHDNQLLAFQTDCNHNIAYIQGLMTETSNILEDINSLTCQYDLVMKDTDEFANNSRELLRRQEELGKKAVDLDYVMGMFEPLESISKTLSTSGTSIIKSGRWRTILNELEEKLGFFESHKFYKDAEVYIMRYRQCITRTLTLMRNYNIDFLKSKLEEVSARLSEGNVDSLKLDIMMYSEFTNELEKQTDNTRFAILIHAIAVQCLGHEEYQGLVSDILRQYFRLRMTLVKIYLEKHGPMTFEKDLKSKSADPIDIVQYCQRSISQYKRLLEKENGIFCKYFPHEAFDKSIGQFVDSELYAFFKQILGPFYDDMRNKILKESSITELSHLTNLLASYYEFEDDAVSHVSGVGEKVEYGDLLEPTLIDSQARLIFRIQNYIDNKLLKYKPRPEDLQLGNRRKSLGRESVLDEFEANLFPELYVPVGKALTILSNLYELVNSMVFDDIAHYIVHSCIFMLKNGAMNLAISHLGERDAKLFLLKNLVLLKNHLNTFDVQFVRTETSLDLTGGIQEIIRIFRSGKLSVNFNNQGGFLELVKKSAPKVINDMIDAKKEIELELSNAFNDYITDCANVICEPILNEEKVKLKDKFTELNDNVLMKIQQIYKQVTDYIDEKEFVAYLLNVLSRLIYSTYEAYYRTVEGKLTSSSQADELNEIMEPDTFFNFLAETITGLQDTSESRDDVIKFSEDILNGQDAIFDHNIASHTEIGLPQQTQRE